jgi:hypothetical protein
MKVGKHMRKLKPKELDDLKKELGGDIVIHDSPSLDAAFGTPPDAADARVPSLDALRGNAAGASTSAKAPESDASTARGAKKKRATSAPGSNPGKSDYSVRFSSKNVDRGSKVAIVSSKSNKVVYEQG